MSSFRTRYQTIEFGETDIHVRTLLDNQQFSDDDGRAAKLNISSAMWPLFGVIWPSGEILAQLMFHQKTEGLRILEVGCGIGLASLMLNHRAADITATDYHPEAEDFMLQNTRLNRDRVIPFVRTGWGDAASTLGRFDLVIGSDLLYESGHAELLSGFIDRHTEVHGNVLLVDPGRGHHARFSKKMVALGFAHSQNGTECLDSRSRSIRGQVLRYHR